LILPDVIRLAKLAFESDGSTLLREEHNIEVGWCSTEPVLYPLLKMKLDQAFLEPQGLAQGFKSQAAPGSEEIAC